ncbi:gephyrin-like molybdotransferase Glp [Paenibacillus sp. KS-LC4]|uniref:molybdopterin molybdotransferase MoeA n=1 Tax=Paenibacillus sp. KS-LC4 TaxID=2979727 RepID=UPI0030D4E0B3
MNIFKEKNDSKHQRKAVSLGDAQQALLARVHQAGTVKIALADAAGYCLAETIHAREAIPHFRRSGMDGYAIRTADLQQLPVMLEVIEQLPSGTVPTKAIVPGTAARIMTGGMVPDGADAVMMLEMTEEAEKAGQPYVMLRKAVPAGANISPIGEEAFAGERMVEAGERIGPGQMALLSALGCAEVLVYRKPLVAIISTGSELLSIHEPLEGAKIRNSNIYMLATQVRACGAEPLFVEHIADDYAIAEGMLYKLLASDVDIVIATGGVSVGDYDIIADFFQQWEGETLFNKIAMRPGSPTSAGVWKNKLFLGLSGNPAACFIGCELLVRPVLLAMQGERKSADAQRHDAFLAADYNKVNAYPRYVRGIRYFNNGLVYVKQEGVDMSSALVTLKDANCLIVIPPAKTSIKAGTLVSVIPLAASTL